MPGRARDSVTIFGGNQFIDVDAIQLARAGFIRMFHPIPMRQGDDAAQQGIAERDTRDDRAPFRSSDASNSLRLRDESFHSRHHDRDDDRDYAVAERFQASLAYCSSLSFVRCSGCFNQPQVE
jgi:hypothetical protein